MPRASVATLSNAMDVGAPSNFARLNALSAGAFSGDAGPSIAAYAVDDDTTTARMAATYDQDGYLPCPHTAVGLEVIERWRESSGEESMPVLTLATAHPAKFPEAVRLAIGSEPPRHQGLVALASAERHVVPLPARVDALKDALLSVTSG